MSDFKKQILLQTVILLALIVVLGSGILFFNSLIVKNVETIVDAKSDVSVRQGTFQALAELKKESLEANSLLPSLRAKLPTKDDLFVFSRNLSALAANRKVQFGFSFAPETQSTGESASYVPFEISSGGELANLISFISDIENSNLIIQIAGVDLSSPSTKINGRVYYK
jgi:Tfp pilus assembly protein PilO